MKNYILLCSVCVTFSSFGQMQESKLENQKEKEPTDQQIEVKQTSKTGKINKRIVVDRPKKAKTSVVEIKER